MRRQRVHLFARGQTLRYVFHSLFMGTLCVAGVDRILLAYQRARHLDLNSRVEIRVGLLDVEF